MERPDFCERCGRSDGNLGGCRGRRGGSRGGVRGGGVRGGRRGRGRGRSRGGGGGSRGDGDEKKLVVDPHRHPGVFIARSNGDDMLVTRNMVVGESVYGEERISIDGENQDKIEYRIWNPFRSKLSAAIISGIENIYIQPGTKILYLGAANGTTVSHVSDIVGTEGLVYAVEVSHQSVGDLLNLAKTRTNIIPIIEDARHPHKYQMLVDTVDTIYADVAQPDQAHILALNAQNFMKKGGKFVITIKASYMNSTAAPEVVFADEIKKLRSEKLKPYEQITLEPFEQEHAVVVGVFQPMDKNKNEEERKEQ